MTRPQVIAELRRWVAESLDVERRLVRLPREVDGKYRWDVRRERDVAQRAVDMLESDERRNGK